MKKLHLLPLLFLFALMSCKKEDKEAAPSINEQIKGRWDVIRDILVYYDKDNREIYRKPYEIRMVFTFDGTAYREYMGRFSPYEGTYTLSSNNGKDYITLQGLPNNPIEVKGFSETNMSWIIEHQDNIYRDPVTYQEKTAHHAVYILEFERR
ncbi:hypothetical protein CLV24_11218 [Pontibacter ummariensis]|uniref:Lipocalin-like domain-containing protein n=1 Tax=Pontibacter ummariensis TaxID=1610492 RepID=A0A239H795_9BACT|nr:hypothetical protein [Pontibacter ummariensis]PRY10891.1 hypothetical protein CLV24_11218 [Pontibacter ummariensis]SNS76134.1 hypothetical protein SAMN06296052_112160 [Pontibacter ummariensis]